MELVPGSRLSRYRVESLLGRGGMGEVYKARDEALDRAVALKILRQDLAIDDERLRRFAKEAKLASSLNHPHIVHVYDVGESDGFHFIAMEYVDGMTFRQLMADHGPSLTPLRYLEQVADALAKAHEAGVVHRDLKPDNILVSKDGYAKVADFGLAKLIPFPVDGGEAGADSGSLTADGALVGTLGYMAPEQVLGGAVDHRVDIFAFGCIVHESMTRSRTFQASSPFETMKKIAYDAPARLPAGAPAGLQRIVDRCLEKKPSARYQSLKEVAGDLRSVRHQLEAGSSAPTEQRPIAVVRRPRFVTAALTAVVLLLASAWALVRIMPGRANEPVPAKGAAPSGPWPPRVRPAPSAAAYEDYLRGRVDVSNENAASNEKAIHLLEHAVTTDPQFAGAYAQLAIAYNIKSFYHASAAEKLRLDEEAAFAVEKALALDPDLAEGYLARGLILWTHANRFPHEQAVLAFKRALMLDPKLDQAHHQLGVVYFHVGLFDQAWVEIQKAVTLNPGNTLARFRFGVIDMYRGRYENALSIFTSTSLTKNPSLWTHQTANALYRLGREKEASDLLDQYVKNNPKDEGGVVSSVQAILFARSGQRLQSDEAIVRAVKLGQGFGHFHHTAYNIGSAYALMNRPAEAVKWLQVAIDDGFPCYPVFKNDQNLDGLRADPRFVSLMSALQKKFEQYARSL